MTAPQCKSNPGIQPRRLAAKHLSKLLSSYTAADDESCWLWRRSIVSHGYGQFVISLGRRGLTRREQAHRVVYKLLVGPIPDGAVLDHLCRVPACVNPRHLEPVTSRVNTLRGETLAASQVTRASCPKGHPYEGDNLHVDRAGRRHCRACERERYHRRDKAKEHARNHERWLRTKQSGGAR